MVNIAGSGIYLEFDEESGSIHSLKDGSREYIGEELPIYKIALRNESGGLEFAEKQDMRLSRIEKTDRMFRAVYEGCAMKVSVSARVEDCVEWKISVTPEDDRILEWINFPQIAVPDAMRDKGGRFRILWGFNEGGIVDDLTYKESGAFCYKDLQYPSISCIPMYPAIVESQFLAYFDDEAGLYFGAHDSEDNIKGLDFYRYGKGILFQMRHFCGRNPGERYNMEFPMIMKFFTGEWQDAAQIYKDWFRSLNKEQFIPISQNTSLPEWYSQSPVVLIWPVRGRHDGDIMNPNKLFPYCNAMEHVERLEKELDSRIMVVLMHWEGTAPWAPPYVWPPYGGEEELKKFIDALHARGDVFGVYCSGMGWTQYSKLVEGYNREAEFEEKNLGNAMCLSPEQELPYCAIVPNIRAGYDMCPTQRFTVEVMKEQVKYMVAADIDYIQLLDQNHGGTSYFCYSKKHGHPPVPGKWQVDAVKAMLTEIEQETGKVLLGCESAAAESYIPWLLFNDNRFELNYATGRPVPVYAYLYHEYVNNFTGNQVSAQAWLDHKRSPENILERLAYSFSAGDMLALVLNEDGNITWNWGFRELSDIPDQKNIKNLVKNLNAWRQGIGKKYLHTGNMVKPIVVKCGQNTIYGPNDHKFLIEKLHTSAWESEDGSYGQFLINYNTSEVDCELSLPQGEYRLYDDQEHCRALIGENRYKITVKPLSAVLLENPNRIR